MSISTSTAAQRITLRDKAVIAEKMLQNFAQDSIVPNTEQITEIDAALTALTAALQAAGGVILPGTQTIVTSTVKRPVGTVSGSGTFGTFTVANGVITGIVLSAS